MGLIEVNGIRIYAHHGCLGEEATIGGNYRVDIAVEGDFSVAEHTDDLGATVDYGRVTAIVQEQMGIRSALIEHVVRRIHDSLKAEWSADHRWKVRLVKERPPIDGDVTEAAYVLEG